MRTATKADHDHSPGGHQTSKNRSIKYVFPVCGAIIRATKQVNVVCGDCNAPFEKASPIRNAGLRAGVCVDYERPYSRNGPPPWFDLNEGFEQIGESGLGVCKKESPLNCHPSLFVL